MVNLSSAVFTAVVCTAAASVRIANIDAPELPDGAISAPVFGHATRRDALRGFVGQGRVWVGRLGIDGYGRTLATVTVNGRDAGAYLVWLGLSRWWE